MVVHECSFELVAQIVYNKQDSPSEWIFECECGKVQSVWYDHEDDYNEIIVYNMNKYTIEITLSFNPTVIVYKKGWKFEKT